MKISEIIIHLAAGKKAKRKYWDKNLPGVFIKQSTADDSIDNQLPVDDKEPVILAYQSAISLYQMSFSIIKSCDWTVEINKKDVKEVFLNVEFSGVIDYLNLGAKAYLPQWEDQWISLNKAANQIILNFYAPSPLQLQFTDLIADDWEIIE